VGKAAGAVPGPARPGTLALMSGRARPTYMCGVFGPDNYPVLVAAVTRDAGHKQERRHRDAKLAMPRAALLA
jgi:hypothetical protein